MSPSPEHEALHRVFQYDRKLFARSISRVLGVLIPEPSDVQVLTVDLTETRPLEPRPVWATRLASGYGRY